MSWIFKNKKLPSETESFMSFTENINTSQGKKWKALLFAFFVVVFSQFFAGVAHAGFCYCAANLSTTSTGGAILDPNRQLFNTITSDTACNDKCFGIKDGTYYYYSETVDATYAKSDDLFKAAMSPTNHAAAVSNPATNASNEASTVEIKKEIDDKAANAANCSASAWTIITNPMEAVKCLLYGVLQALGWLLSLAAIIFQWVVDPANISGVGGLLVKPEVKNVWVMVRDTLNMTFIMILLFAAFCTVFQVEQWNLKKVWLSILINALLVNFSFAIARIFIDISNVAMYYFLNHLFSGTGGGSGSAIMASFSEQAKLSVLLAPADFAKAEIPYFLASIVFTFILAMTLLVLAVLFLIRLVMLTILLMFSPVGFVGFIFPGTKTFASQWWEQLFKYSFFGPVMVFMMMVAITIMKASATSGFMGAAAKNVPAGMSANWLASASYFAIPIIILWIAMGISQKMGIAGADKVVGAGKKWGGTVGKWVGNKALGGAKWAAYKNPVARGVGAGAKEKLGINKFNKWIKSPSKIEAGVKGGIIGLGKPGGMRGGAKSEREKLQYAEVRDAVEEHKKNKTSHSQLALDLKSNNDVKKKAAAMAMAENDDIRNITEFQNGLAALAGDADLTSKFVQKGHSAIQDFTGLKSAISALGNDTKSIGALIDKVGGNAVKMSHTDFDDLNVAIDLKNPGGAGDGIKKQLESRIKKEGHVQTLVDSKAASLGGGMPNYQLAYHDLIADMSPEELSKQKDSLHNDVRFVDYVMANSGNNQTFSDEHRKNVFAELSGKKKATWVNNGIHP